jgi:hypothetical protein
MRKIDKRRLETNKKMLSKIGIIAFTAFGVIGYLVTVLAIVFTSPKPMAAWKVLAGSIGGSVLVGVFIILVLCIFRYFLINHTNNSLSENQ